MVQYQKTFSTEQDDSEDSSQGQQMKDVMMKSFGFLSSISLGILAVCFIVVVLDTNNSIKEQSQNELENQIERQAMAVLNEGGDYLIRFLNNYDQSVVSMIAQLSSNTLRRDGYSMSMEYESYFDYTNDYLAQPLSQDDRQVKDVSLSHSSYYVTGALPSDIATLASDIQTYRNLTAHLDNYFPFVYDNKESLVAAYTGYSTSTSLFRHYPGTETLTVDPNREYDPVNRPWYHDALTQWSDYHGGGAYSAPYADLFGKGWMITGSRVVLERSLPGYVDTEAVLGVSGADILISDIQSVLASVSFLDTGKLSLFTGDGQVVSDVEWIPDPQSETPFTYRDLQAPAVSTAQWNEIRQVVVGTAQAFSFGGYRVYAKHLSEYNGQYYLIVFVKTSEILAPSEVIIDDMERNNVTISVTLIVVFVCLFLVLLLMMLHLINGILNSFKETERNVDMLLANVGHTERGIADGMVEVKNANNVELSNMQSSMNAMIATLQRARSDRMNVVTTSDNSAGFQGMTQFCSMVPVTTVQQEPQVFYTYSQPETATTVPPPSYS